MQTVHVLACHFLSALLSVFAFLFPTDLKVFSCWPFITLTLEVGRLADTHTHTVASWMLRIFIAFHLATTRVHTLCHAMQSMHLLNTLTRSLDVCISFSLAQSHSSAVSFLSVVGEVWSFSVFRCCFCIGFSHCTSVKLDCLLCRAHLCILHRRTAAASLAPLFSLYFFIYSLSFLSSFFFLFCPFTQHQ